MNNEVFQWQRKAQSIICEKNAEALVWSSDLSKQLCVDDMMIGRNPTI